MNFVSPGITYVLLVIPTMTAIAVAGQGLYKIMRREAGGKIILGFGVCFLAIIAAAYFFFIK